MRMLRWYTRSSLNRGLCPHFKPFPHFSFFSKNPNLISYFSILDLVFGLKRMIVHGGAWDIPKELHEDHRKGCSRALEVGYDLLQNGRNALDAVEATVASMEEDCIFDAGCGSFLNEKGEVEMDAMLMDGRTLGFGSVAAIGKVRHPIKVARLVMERTKHCMLVGEGATDFAREMGFEMIEDHCLVSEREMARWMDIQRIKGFHQKDAFVERGPNPMGTVGAVAIDDNGDIAVATSTGGTPHKMPGRVGDSPLVGCGTYADNSSAGVSATGYGEALMKVCIGRRVCQSIENGMTAKQAAENAISFLSKRVDGHGGVIVLDRRGETSYAFNTPRMAVGFIDRSGRRRVRI
jgi:beta-aspartyl-peptidase (threonine type)